MLRRISHCVLGIVASLVPGVTSHAQLMPESLYRVQANDTEIVIVAPNGERRSVPWSALTKVVIRTTDEGPSRPDVFWEFYAAPSPVVISFPGGATGEQEVLRALGAKLPSFRDKEVIRAMGSTSNDTFVVWERSRL